VLPWQPWLYWNR